MIHKPNNDNNRIIYLWLTVVVITALLPYISSLKGGFTLDDWDLIVNAPAVHSLGNLPQIFGVGFLPEVFGRNLTYYRPLVTLSYQINYVLSGPDPFAFRLINLALEALAAVLVFFLALRLTDSKLAAGVAGMAFSVIPCHAESVAWISGRTDLLSVVFILTSMLLFIKSLQMKNRFHWPLALISSVFFCLALFSKEHAMMLPVLFAAYVWIFCDSEQRKKFWKHDLWKWVVLLLPPLIVYLILRKHVVGVTVDKYLFLALGRRLMGVGIAYASYLRMLFIPREARVVYDVFPIGIKYPAIAAAAWLAPVALIVCSILLKRRRRVISFAAFWILITLLPVSNILPTFGPLPAERFAYFASVGSSLVIGWIVMMAYKWQPKSIRVWPAAVVLLVFGYLAYCGASAMASSRYWRSDLDWAQGVAESNTRFREFQVVAASNFSQAGYKALNAHKYQAAAFYYEQAALEYEKIIKTDPQYLPGYINIADIRLMQGRPNESIKILTEAKAIFDSNPTIIYRMGMAYKRCEMKTEAVREFEEVIRLKPGSKLAKSSQMMIQLMKK